MVIERKQKVVLRTDAVEAGEDRAERADVGRVAAQEVAKQAGLLGLDEFELLGPVVGYLTTLR